MPRTAPDAGFHHVVVARKRADGRRVEWTGQLPAKVAEYLMQHTIELGSDTALTAADYEEALADHRGLVRQLDVLLNGEGAAQQASLSDIVKQVRREGIKAPDYTVQQHPDVTAVDRFAAAMKERMAEMRSKGKYGWDDPSAISVDRLQRLMQACTCSEPVDIGNYAMMLFNRAL